MTNTRILTQDFEYLKPETMPELFELLNRYGPDAKVIAGGTDVVPQLKYGTISPGYLIDVMKITDLSSVREDAMLRIGATAKLRDVKQQCGGRKDTACLHDALCSIGKVQVMNMGTLGGNLCTASPAADSAPALLILEAQVKLISSQGERVIPLSDFFRGPNLTAIELGEILSEIQVPTAQANTGNAFIKIARVAADISKISCAVAVERNGDTCAGCRIAMGAVAAMPIRIPSAESQLSGQTIDGHLLDETADVLSAAIQPLTDMRSTEFYRKQVSRILFKDTFAKAWNRAGEEE